MKIIIENLQDKYDIDENMDNILEEAVKISLKSDNFKTPSEVSILMVDNESIRKINSEYRGVDRPTDVLSFPVVNMHEGEIIDDSGDVDLDTNLLILGDIIISIEKTIEQAEMYGHSFERELAFLVTHGMYHLLGYDHETPEEEKVMMEKQEKVLGIMGLGRDEK